MIGQIIKKFGVSAVSGIVVGIGFSIWISPTTPEGIVLIIVVGMLLTIVLIEVVRAVIGGGSRE